MSEQLPSASSQQAPGPTPLHIDRWDSGQPSHWLVPEQAEVVGLPSLSVKVYNGLFPHNGSVPIHAGAPAAGAGAGDG